MTNKGMLIGYARVSTEQQNLEMQIDALEKYGCWKIFEEKKSGKTKERPQLQEMLSMLRPGDTVVIYKLDRISRSLRHLLELSDFFEKNKINLVSISENIDTSTPMGRFFFHSMGALNQLERDLASERTKEGLSAARARGRSGGRPKADNKKIKTALKMYDSKEHSISEICNTVGISVPTLYRYVNDRNRTDKKN